MTYTAQQLSKSNVNRKFAFNKSVNIVMYKDINTDVFKST